VGLFLDLVGMTMMLIFPKQPTLCTWDQDKIVTCPFIMNV
jgi:hypothetical protein